MSVYIMSCFRCNFGSMVLGRLLNAKSAFSAKWDRLEWQWKAKYPMDSNDPSWGSWLDMNSKGFVGCKCCKFAGFSTSSPPMPRGVVTERTMRDTVTAAVQAAVHATLAHVATQAKPPGPPQTSPVSSAYRL